MGMDVDHDIVLWLEDAEYNKRYETTVPLRVMNIEEFVRKIREEARIVGIAVEGNILSFIIDKDEKKGD